MWWSFAPLVGLVVVQAPALAAQPQCRLALSSPPARPTPQAQSSHSPSSVSVSISKSANPPPTSTPFVPFAYGSEPIRGVNLYVPSRSPGLVQRAREAI